MKASALQSAQDFAMQFQGTEITRERKAGISKEAISLSLFVIMLFVLAMVAMDIIVVPGARSGLTERYDVVMGTIKSEGLWFVILGLVVLMVVMYVVQNEFHNSGE